jgi:hypothetical protein
MLGKKRLSPSLLARKVDEIVAATHPGSLPIEDVVIFVIDSML